ncbi:MAG: sigma-54-dependent Fis family transcriptional regulator [Proteobacteria bacterium]|nr:sigma-54-dependent Fis family transcriptional regulator [Pseudomonadota bacterium]
MAPELRVLVVDDEPHVRASLASWLREDGYQVQTAESGEQALDRLATTGAAILLIDIQMPGMSGLELQARVRELAPSATVIVMTAHASVETAVQALKQGAYDFIVKPFDPDEMSRLVAKAAERHALISENRALRQRVSAGTPQLIHGPRSPLVGVLGQLEQVAETETSVLISGESGTGKELIARLLHAQSPRRHGPLVVVNCGALAEGVLESELFGHEKGAFTGALGRREGKLEQARGGTLFLDEIGDIPPKVQVDLLRVLEERQVVRVGGNQPIAVDFRLVTATHRALPEEIRAGRFRADLYFRINVFQLTLPPLRERLDDIGLLAEHFRERFARQMNRRVAGFSREALALLCAHGWPGNVRELQNAIERAVVVCRGATLEPEHLPFPWQPREAGASDETLAAVEERHVRQIVERCQHNVTQAAKLLGIDRVTLHNKLKRYGMVRPQ